MEFVPPFLLLLRGERRRQTNHQYLLVGPDSKRCPQYLFGDEQAAIVERKPVAIVLDNPNHVVVGIAADGFGSGGRISVAIHVAINLGLKAGTIIERVRNGVLCEADGMDSHSSGFRSVEMLYL